MGNPVRIVEIIAMEVDGIVSLVEMIVNEEDGGDQIRARDITTDSRQWRAHVFARLGNTARTTTEIQTLQRSEFAEMKNWIRRLEERIGVLRHAPTRVVIGLRRNAGPGRDLTRTTQGVEILVGNPDQGQDTRPATLTRNPKLLGILWDEYQNGVGGQKPASEFSREERGRCKAVYSQRKPFWDCMERQLSRGATKLTALARINRIYGHHRLVTKMLIAIRKDERRGGHNSLNQVYVEEGRRGRRQEEEGNRGE